MFIGKANFAGVDILLTNPRQRLGGKTPTVRSFEVTKFHYGDRRVGIALELFGVVNGRIAVL